MLSRDGPSRFFLHPRSGVGGRVLALPRSRFGGFETCVLGDDFFEFWLGWHDGVDEGLQLPDAFFSSLLGTPVIAVFSFWYAHMSLFLSESCGLVLDLCLKVTAPDAISLEVARSTNLCRR